MTPQDEAKDYLARKFVHAQGEEEAMYLDQLWQVYRLTKSMQIFKAKFKEFFE